jgi:L-asparaginase
VDGDEVVVGFRVPPQDVIDCRAPDPNVTLIKIVVGMDDAFLRYTVESGARGVILEILGGGRVPPWWMPAIREAVASGVPVIVTSRCPSGRIYDSYRFEGSYRDLAEAGVLFAGDLNGPKARIRLMAALDAAKHLDLRVADFFERRQL